MAILGQEPVDRTVFQTFTKHGDRIIEATLLIGSSKRHA